MPSALEEALAELALGPELHPSDTSAVDAWLARHRIDGEDAAVLRDELERLLVYRGLVQGTLREALLVSIPRSAARLGPLFDEYLSRFLRERGPRSHYLRDLTGELLEFCEPLWASDPRVPDYIRDLARHESLRIEVGARESGSYSQLAPELELDRPVSFVASAHVAHYEYAVHRLIDDATDRTLPEQAKTALFVYRSPEHEVRYLELTPLAGEILARLVGGETSLRAALLEACAAQQVELTPQVLEGTARVLADLAERGALLGGLLATGAAGVMAEDARGSVV